MASVIYTKINTDQGVEVHWASFTSSDTCDHYRTGNARDVQVFMTGGNSAGSAQLHGALVSGTKLTDGPGSFLALQHYGSSVALASLLNSGVITLLTRTEFIRPVAGTANEVTVKLLIGN